MSNQTFELSRWLGTELAARKFPYRVIYAPERTDRASVMPVILLSRDLDASESVGTPKGQQANPHKSSTRRIPCKLKIYARASLPGSSVIDHEELADYLVDAVLVALDEWSTAQRGGGIEYGEMQFMTPEELVTDDGKPEGWPGLVYLIRFTIGRGVVKRDFLKQARPTGSINGVGSTVEVRLNTEDEPEVVPVGPQPPP